MAAQFDEFLREPKPIVQTPEELAQVHQTSKELVEAFVAEMKVLIERNGSRLEARKRRERDGKTDTV